MKIKAEMQPVRDKFLTNRRRYTASDRRLMKPLPKELPLTSKIYKCLPWAGKGQIVLRTFTQKFSNIDFFLQILPLKDDELVMSEM